MLLEDLFVVALLGVAPVDGVINRENRTILAKPETAGFFDLVKVFQTALFDDFLKSL